MRIEVYLRRTATSEAEMTAFNDPDAALAFAYQCMVDLDGRPIENHKLTIHHTSSDRWYSYSQFAHALAAARDVSDWDVR